jgi:hypothetical protein
LWVGLAFVGFGDDVMIGASELNDVALKDGELMLDPDVDGIDASLRISTNKGLVEIFTDECLLSPILSEDPVAQSVVFSVMKILASVRVLQH